MGDYLPQIFGLFILAMGIWMLYLGRQNLAKARLVKNWPKIEGKIIQSEVHKMPGLTPNSASRLNINTR